MNEYFVLYDTKDECVGSYDRKQLKRFIGTKDNAFNSIISRLKGGYHKYIYVKGSMYRVYIYVEQQ